VFSNSATTTMTVTVTLILTMTMIGAVNLTMPKILSQNNYLF
jgi:hypothetical protein